MIPLKYQTMLDYLCLALELQGKLPAQLYTYVDEYKVKCVMGLAVPLRFLKEGVLTSHLPDALNYLSCTFNIENNLEFKNIVSIFQTNFDIVLENNLHTNLLDFISKYRQSVTNNINILLG